MPPAHRTASSASGPPTPLQPLASGCAGAVATVGAAVRRGSSANGRWVGGLKAGLSGAPRVGSGTGVAVGSGSGERKAALGGGDRRARMGAGECADEGSARAGGGGGADRGGGAGDGGNGNGEASHGDEVVGRLGARLGRSSGSTAPPAAAESLGAPDVEVRPSAVGAERAIGARVAFELAAG
ncbi:hypothetical protein KFE25_003190 [Diacronema lutheri]|uniref:Uncharacterized protein n=1 Tax=Diacronema lutheri TaxID=2081491 RepID=A0A8J5X5A7_DIALT|nr:hypothetical protein KFE25_003190 [Diacronema lutheri]